MQNKSISQLEFVALMASLMSVVALAIDALLPALNIISSSLNVIDSRDNQLLIIFIFIGLGIGPLLFGPLSDSLGRKPLVYAGFAIFIFASFICVSSESLEIMLLGRLLQGVGLSGPRTISISIIRDTYSGNYMARIMSFVTVIFILVPIVAPAIGKLILDSYGWEYIFYIQLIFTVLIAIWFYIRQPETLLLKNKIKFTSTQFISSSKELLKYKDTIGFTIISGFITGSFMVYLSTAQQIFENQYQMVNEFPYIFAGLAVSVGSATFLNGTLVVKLGMERIVTIALSLFSLNSFIYVVLFSMGINPSIYVLLIFFFIQFFSIGFLFGNIRALAMQPVGHIAGMGAAITGFISTLMAVPISIYIGRNITTSALPLFVGFLICGSISIVVLLFIKKTRLKLKFSE
ncbi:MFS transporter [uncultured Lutibacter sp.]|uniref:MFS transporter n=1 Tax=uncultured Lutibacter sp. TaxID=437739 RepID=UPI00260BE4DE|nr:MFS transporter [uncultured Lutibacter sp.]